MVNRNRKNELPSIRGHTIYDFTIYVLRTWQAVAPKKKFGSEHRSGS